jgi:hypothetical protein
MKPLIVAICLIGMLAVSWCAALAQSAAYGDDTSNTERAMSMTFTLGHFTYASRPDMWSEPLRFISGGVELTSLTARFLRLDGPFAVMEVTSSEYAGRTVWSSPDDSKNSNGWSLKQVLSGVDQNKTTTSSGIMTGGPFFLRGVNMIACQQADAVEILSMADAEQKLGRHNFMIAFERSRCVDVPDGVAVDVRAVGKKIAMFFFRDPPSPPFFVLRTNVFNKRHDPVPEFSPAQ